jgi:hypothetical protein
MLECMLECAQCVCLSMCECIRVSGDVSFLFFFIFFISFNFFLILECTHMYTHILTYTHIYSHIYLHTHIYTYILTYVLTYLFSTHEYILICELCAEQA